MGPTSLPNVSLLVDRNVESGRGERTAILCRDERITYAQLLEQVCRVAWSLRELGVRREERVLLLLDDTPAFPAVFLGAIRIGAVPVPVNPLYKPSDFRFFLEDSYARVVVVDDAFAAKADEAVEGSREPVRVVTPAELVQAGAAAGAAMQAPVSTHEEDMAFWLYSSGSTGRPKAVIHRHSDVAATATTYASSVLRLTEDDVTYSTTKLYHAYGLGNGISFPYWAGATTVLTPGRPLPDTVYGAIDRHGPTCLFSVPTIYNALLNSPGASDRDLSSVRLCVSAAEPLPPEVFRRWEKAYGLSILDGIGSTEMLHIYCSNAPGAVRPGSSGRAVPGYELEIRDEDGRPVPTGAVGELWVKGDSALVGYWHHRDRTRRCIAGEWFRTGDRYRSDEDGYLWYEGRADDMIKVGGLWVSPIEIENVLMEHRAVLESAVVGIDVGGLTRVRAHVVCQAGVTPDETLAAELVELCKTRLQRYQYPHIVEFEEELPKTMTGKIQRFALRARPSVSA